MSSPAFTNVGSDRLRPTSAGAPRGPRPSNPPRGNPVAARLATLPTRRQELNLVQTQLLAGKSLLLTGDLGSGVELMGFLLPETLLRRTRVVRLEPGTSAPALTCDEPTLFLVDKWYLTASSTPLLDSIVAAWSQGQLERVDLAPSRIRNWPP